MNRFTMSWITLLLMGLPVVRAGEHIDLFVGHSPLDPNTPPTEEEPCPTVEPLKLFQANEDAVGGQIPPGGGLPADTSVVFSLPRLTFNGALSKPEFGGWVYGSDFLGLNLIAPDNECHGMSTDWTGGQSFNLVLRRSFWPEDVNYGVAEPFGTAILPEDGAEWIFGNENGAHVHPLFLSRRTGSYIGEYQFNSDQFLISDTFSLQHASTTCAAAVPVDLSDAFNADVVDSDASDAPTSFDGAGNSWVLNGHYGTDRGLPADGRLDVFPLGGHEGEGLVGSQYNCLYDNGVLSSAATIDLVAQALNGNYQSMELLIAASGAFDSADQLLVRLNYSSGSQQVITIRQAVVAPKFFPIADWQITTDTVPVLSVGPAGTREGGGFVRGNGSDIDKTPNPADSFYFQRVTFSVDAARSLQSISFDNYTGAGRIGVFALVLMADEICPTGDADADGDVDGFDYSAFVACVTGPGIPFSDPDCGVFDFDDDDDVDLTDFGQFQTIFSGTIE